MIRKIVRVSSKGQIVLPKEVRQKAGIKEGDQLKIELKEGKIFLKKEEPYTDREETRSNSYKGAFTTEDLLRFLQKEDDKDIENIVLEAKKEKKKIFVSLTVIIELTYILERLHKLPREEIRKIIEGLLCLPVDIESKDTVLEALKIYEINEWSFLKSLLIAGRLKTLS